jgi:CDGSH iron-sulfur domain-containing protein 3
MSDKVQLRFKENGPIRVSGSVDIVDAQGKVIENKSDFSLCRCGLSKTKPFCDGSHNGNFEASEGLGN